MPTASVLCFMLNGRARKIPLSAISPFRNLHGAPALVAAVAAGAPIGAGVSHF